MQVGPKRSITCQNLHYLIWVGTWTVLLALVMMQEDSSLLNVSDPHSNYRKCDSYHFTWIEKVITCNNIFILNTFLIMSEHALLGVLLYLIRTACMIKDFTQFYSHTANVHSSRLYWICACVLFCFFPQCLLNFFLSKRPSCPLFHSPLCDLYSWPFS